MADRNTPKEFSYKGNGNWQEQSVTKKDHNAILEEKTQENLKSVNSNGSNSSSSGSSGGSSGSTESKKNSSQGKANKEFVQKEFSTLEGDLSLIATTKTIRIKAGDTVSISGVGKYLTGQYLVDTVERRIDKDVGYSHSLTVLKNGFGDGLKKGSATEKVQAKAEQSDGRPEEVKKTLQ